MKDYLKQLFEHEYWANLKVLEAIVLAKDCPKKAIELFSHTIAAQRIWLDRIKGNASEVKVWEVFETEIMLELLEINFADIIKTIDSQDINQLISYKNSKGVHYTRTISQILTHLPLHSMYHRGQVVLLLKSYVEVLPSTDYIFYVN
jgi:uncharacterized damage-inducible protein DinB